jgi:hypothetical protein
VLGRTGAFEDDKRSLVGGASSCAQAFFHCIAALTTTGGSGLGRRAGRRAERGGGERDREGERKRESEREGERKKEREREGERKKE